MPNPPLLPTSTVACRLDIPARKVSRLVERGHLEPAVKAPGPRGAFLFDVSEVERYEREHAASVDGAAVA